MITLLHGDYIEASRNELKRIIDRAKPGKEIRVLEGKNIDDSELTQALESTSLFGMNTLIVIEQLFGKISRQQKRVEALAAILTRQAKETDIVLWEDKEIGAGVIKQLGTGSNVRLFKLPVLIFQFLDGIKPGNARSLLLTYDNLIATEPAELVFSMLVKRIRNLMQIRDGVPPAGLAPWQANRLTTQAKSFTMDQLLAMYKTLHGIEVSIKTGNSPIPLSVQTKELLTEV